MNYCFLNAQVTCNEKYKSIAREQFSLCVEKKIEFSMKMHPSLYITNISEEDTINIKYIFPIYYLERMDEKQILKNMINFDLNPLNQLFIIDNTKCVWTGFFAKGISDERKEINKEFPFKKWIISDDCYLIEHFSVFGITKYDDFEKLLKEKNMWEFFGILDFKGIWAIDEQQQLQHIYQKKNKLIIEEGQLFYEKLIKENGIDCIERMIDGYPCKQLIYK